MVRLLAPLLSALPWGASASSSESSCPGDAAATAGAAQLQTTRAESSRGVVAEHDEHGDSLYSSLDVGDVVSASLSTGERLHAAAAEVRKASAKMKEKYSPSVNEIEDLISGMSGHTSTSQDKCTTQLYELKHQITSIHEQVTSITVEVHSTEASIYSYEESCKEKTAEISVIEKTNEKRTTKCRTEHKTVKKTLTSLQADMVSMKQISSAHLHVSGGSYGGNSGGYNGVRPSIYQPTYRGGMSLIETAEQVKSQESPEADDPQQEPQESPEAEDPQQRVERVQSMVQRTKDMAQRANACVAAANVTKQGGAAGEGPSEDGNTAEVFLEIDQHEDQHENTTSPVRCPEYMKPGCRGAACVHGRWVCGGGSVRCSPNKPTCHRVSCVNGEWVCGGKPEPDQVRCPEYMKPTCHRVSCVNGEWVCGGGCPPNKPKCYPVSCVNGEWVCGGKPEPEPEQCHAVIIELQHIFTTSYVSLTRLIEEYEVTEHSTVCEESVEEEYSKEVNIVQSEADKVCKRVQVLIMSLAQYKLQLTQTIQLEHTMEHSVQVTTLECGSLTETTDYFTEVTDTLTALGNCPGLNDLSFSLPTWSGWASFTQRPGMSDGAVDAAMTAACKSTFGYKYGRSVRAAETAELDERSVQRMPKRNTARQPLLGKCPLCEGARPKTSPSHPLMGRGLARVCWDDGDIIGPDTKRNDCSSGERVALCVYEPTAKPVNPPIVYPAVNPLVVDPTKPYPRPIVDPTKPYPRPVVDPTKPYRR